MSASREKRMRKSAEAKPVVKQEPEKKGMPKAVKWAIGIIVVLAAIAIMAVSLVFGSTYFHKNSVAMTVGEHEITPAEVNYYFREAYYAAAQGSEDTSFLSYMTDMIMEDAVANIQRTYAIYDAAIADGYTLTEEELAELDQEVKDMEYTAESMGASGVDEMLATVYGKGCDQESYRKYREMYMIVSRYTQDATEAQDTTEATLEAYYAEHADELDTVSYRQFFLPVQDTMEDTQALAQTILDEAAENEAVMDQYALEYATEDNQEHYSTTENATLLESINKDSATAEVADWLFDTARVEGDTFYFENSDATGLYLVRFNSRDTGDYNTVNVRHILVSADTTVDDEAKKTAQETAQSYLDQFQNGDKSEDSFAALAEEYSEDNADEGGLYENVYKGQMVEAFENWCFDEARKAGDSGIVETEYGYHVMYFVGEGDSYRNLLAETEILNAFYEEWTAELTADYTVTRDEKGMSFVTTTTSY